MEALDPRRLLIFKTVVDVGSISAGARVLGRTQPSVTEHIRALEHSLKVPLLIRSSKGVVPTEAGRMLLAHANAIAGSLDTAVREATEYRDLRRGRVRLACFPSSLATVVPRAMQRLYEKLGFWLDVHMVEVNPVKAVAMLGRGDVDLALVFRHDDSASEPSWNLFHEIRMGRDKAYVVLPSNHALARQPQLSLADLGGERWAFGRVPCDRHLKETCRRAGFDPAIQTLTDDYVVVQSFVAMGSFSTILNRSSLDAFCHPGVVTRSVPELGSHLVSALCKPGMETIPSISALLAAIAVDRQFGSAQPPVESSYPASVSVP
ncbi:MAG: LysR family transcriptional regulator [Propionibacteriaceae bacterium]|nr:LysR family transcriptional regulator [Propionibacteriaceae bacterium]